MRYVELPLFHIILSSKFLLFSSILCFGGAQISVLCVIFNLMRYPAVEDAFSGGRWFGKHVGIITFAAACT